MTDEEFDAQQAKRRRLYETPLAQWADGDLIEALVQRYTAEPVPPCRVCGRKLSVQSAGGGNATVYGCSGLETDPENPDRVRRIEGRRLADDHYSESRWTQYRGGDTDVLELVRRYTAHGVNPSASGASR